jgi:hypothetical protein
MAGHASSFLIAGRIVSPITRAAQCRVELAVDQFFDELPSPIAHRGLDRVEPSKSWGAVSASHCEESGFVIVLVMAWSPVRRSNAG